MIYSDFLYRKSQFGCDNGFEPNWIPDFLFDFQKSLVEWSVRKGRSAIFADCGMGKSAMQLVWAQNVVNHTGGNVLIITPLSVSQQTVREADKFGIAASVSRDGKVSGHITVTNYEKLHLFDASDYVGVVLDESSILKSFTGATRKRITRFMSKLRFRLLCTATAAPNDYAELGTSSEALGEISHSEMLKRFFQQLDDKGQKKEKRLQDQAEVLIEHDANYFKKLAYRVSQTIGQWRLRHHAVTHFWRWVASWARACRMPSDLGFDDAGFVLPKLTERDHVVVARTLPPGFLFNVPAFGMSQEREERRRTINERCEFVSDLVKHKRPAVVWCHLNPEGDLLEEVIPDAKQICGSMSDERKCELYEAFTDGQLRVLVIKPKIGAFGLNWQHCNHVVTFPTHSYEQYYQCVRRCHRFGQKRPVTLDVVTTEGECRVLGNMRKKADKAAAMFTQLVSEMNNASRVVRSNNFVNQTQVPQWL